MSRTLTLLALVSCVTAAFGCSATTDDAEPKTSTSVDALVAGVPKKPWLELAVADFDPSGQSAFAPAEAAAACAPGETATLANLTYTVSSSANGILGGALGIVGTLLARQPTASDGIHAVWGPMTGSEPAGVYLFQVERMPDGLIAFELRGRPLENDVWRVLFRGATRIVDDAHRTGQMTIDLAALHVVDPVRNKAETGRIDTRFGNLEDVLAIDMTFVDASGPETPPTNANYKCPPAGRRRRVRVRRQYDRSRALGDDGPPRGERVVSGRRRTFSGRRARRGGAGILGDGPVLGAERRTRVPT
jgi:hypothetical protein